MKCNKYTHLIDSEVDAGVWNDAQHVGDIAFIESSRSLLLEYVFGTIHDAWELTCLPQGQPCLQDLQEQVVMSDHLMEEINLHCVVQESKTICRALLLTL